jgi:hypothetical protein
MLAQFYSVVELHDKLDVLHSFIKTHLQAKVLVFLSSCKQVSAEVCHDTDVRDAWQTIRLTPDRVSICDAGSILA